MGSKKANSTARCDAINKIFEEMDQFNLVTLYNRTSYDHGSGRVSWQRKSSLPFIADFTELSIETYLSWVEQSDYSAMLPDGSLLQLTYTYKKNEVKHHRLAYIPSPTVSARDIDGKKNDFVERWLESQDQASVSNPPGLADWIYELLEQDPFSLGLRSSLRFDFDSDAAREGHPESHLTINSSNCRIPCVDIVEPEHFIRFIFSTFYPHEYSEFERFFSGLRRTRRSSVRFKGEERSEIHVNWGDRD